MAMSKSKPKPTPAKAKGTAEDPEVLRKDALAQLAPLELKARGMTVETPEDYLQADLLRGDIVKARKWWGVQMYGDPTDPKEAGIIPPLRKVLDRLYKLNRDVDGPYEILQKRIEGVMTQYNRIQADKIAAEQREADKAKLKLEQEAAEMEAAIQKAKTPQMLAKAMEIKADIETEIEQVQAHVSAPVMGYTSTSRTVKKVKVVDLRKFLKHMAKGGIPLDMLEVVESKLNAAYRSDPETVRTWDGLEEYTEHGLTSKRGL